MKNICPSRESRVEAGARRFHIYSGDSLSTRSLKIECRHKSSPIRERVLNVRTSPLPEPRNSSPRPLSARSPPLTDVFLTSFLDRPLPAVPPPPPSAGRLYRVAASTTPRPHRRPVFLVYPPPRDQIKKPSERVGNEVERKGPRLSLSPSFKGEAGGAGNAAAGRKGPATIYWTCLGEESRLVARLPRDQSSTRKPIKSVDSPKRF